MSNVRDRQYSRRSFIKKGIAGAAAASVALNLPSALGRVASQGRSDTLFAGQAIGSMPSIDPYQHSTAPFYARWEQVYGVLFHTDIPQRKIVPHLAEEWEWRNNGKELHLKLRKGVRWHDGEPFTARDVMFSYDRIKDGSQQADKLSLIESYEAKDPHYLILHMVSPRVSLLGDIYNLVIQPAHGPEKYGSDWLRRPIGTGPYKFVDWRRGEYFRMQRNEDYWGEVPDFPYAVMRSIPEDSTRATSLTAREIDIADRLPPELAAQVRRAPGSRIESVPGLRIMFITLSPVFEPFRNKTVRQAMNHAVDIDSIIEHVLDGNALRLHGPVSPQQVGYNPDIKPYEYDPDKARHMLAQAGYPDGFEIDFWTTTGRFLKDREVAQAVAGQLAEVGVRCRLHTPEYAILWDNFTSGNLGMCLQGRGSVIDADVYYHQYFRTGVTKRTMFSNPDIDRLIDAQQVEFDESVREQMLLELTARIHEEAPMIHLYNELHLYGVQDHVDYEPTADERIWPSRAKRR